MLSLIILLANAAFGWSKYEISLYQDRKFLELQLHLHLKQDIKRSKLIGAQQLDLVGCKDVTHFSQKTSAIIKCIGFLNREEDLKIIKTKNQALIEDLNNLCRQKSNEEGFFETLLSKKTDLRMPHWKPCRLALWNQIYLYAEAEFNTQPVKTMAFIRKARRNWGENNHGENRLKQIINP